MYWDRPITTDRRTDHNRPDIVLIDKANKTGTIIDVAVPLTHNLSQTEREKVSKYQDLQIELKRMWKLREIKIIPAVISVEGVATKKLLKSLEALSLPKGVYIQIQKAVILETCRIVRKFLAID